MWRERQKETDRDKTETERDSSTLVVGQFIAIVFLLSDRVSPCSPGWPRLSEILPPLLGMQVQTSNPAIGAASQEIWHSVKVTDAL